MSARAGNQLSDSPTTFLSALSHHSVSIAPGANLPGRTRPCIERGIRSPGGGKGLRTVLCRPFGARVTRLQRYRVS